MATVSQNSKRKIKLTTGDLILQLLFYISIGLTIWGINIYRLTIIESKYLFASIVFGTIIVFAGIRFFYNRYSVLWNFILSIAIGSGFAYFGLLYVNKSLAEKETLTQEFQIVQTGNLARRKHSSCFRPYAVIDFYGTQKQLLFYCEYEKTIKNYSKVTVTHSKGFFGFWIIKSNLLKN
jgi:hypothetical protein